MSEPYKAKKIPNHWRSSPKTQVMGKMIALSGLRLTNRGTWLMHPRTRASPKHAILELTVTDEDGIEPGKMVSSVIYVGFLEVEIGGIVVSGDPVKIQGKSIGEVVGFSDIHCPNHLNVMVSGTPEFIKEYITNSKDKTIVKTKYALEDEVIFGRKY
jgi:hypothetical protein